MKVFFFCYRQDFLTNVVAPNSTATSGGHVIAAPVNLAEHHTTPNSHTHLHLHPHTPGNSVDGTGDNGGETNSTSTSGLYRKFLELKLSPFPRENHFLRGGTVITVYL